jgi:hypothetical protein
MFSNGSNEVRDIPVCCIAFDVHYAFLRRLAIKPIGDGHCGTQAGSVRLLRQCNQVSRDCAQRLVVRACGGDFHSECFAEGFVFSRAAKRIA